MNISDWFAGGMNFPQMGLQLPGGGMPGGMGGGMPGGVGGGMGGGMPGGFGGGGSGFNPMMMMQLMQMMQGNRPQPGQMLPPQPMAQPNMQRGQMIPRYKTF